MKGEKLECLSVHLKVLFLFASIRVHSRLRFLIRVNSRLLLGLVFLCLSYGNIDY